MISRRVLMARSAALAMFPFACSAAAEESDFAAWLAAFRSEALANGIGTETLDLALAGVAPIPRIIELDRAQPETTVAFARFLARVLTPALRKKARARLAENRTLLAAVAARYGVQARFIVALWGLETSFGAATGNKPVIGALVTLAYDGRRSTLFRQELMAALRIVERFGLDPHTLLGSWAGAMGQCQFMPSSYLNYAVSYRGDGPPDIWSRREDVFASIANYLAQSGWHGGVGWGRSVRLPPGGALPIGLGTTKSLGEWTALGVRRADGGPLPKAALEASIVEPGGSGGPTLLVYDNYRVILKWNASNYFATTVGYLADALEGQ